MSVKFYLSSYKFGSPDNVAKFKTLLVNTNKKAAYIGNALDCFDDLERRQQSEQEEISYLATLGVKADIVDLRQYFGQTEVLKKVLADYDVFWVRGGNTFVLRQAMALSGFDVILKEIIKLDRSIVYAGYSAGACVLAPTLKGLAIVDDPNQKPYGQDIETIWNGLGLIDYSLAPHYKSDHPESADIEKEVQFMIDNKMLFKVLRDGEVIIIE
ncbi:MAG: Type 1 glutamine amidotransferase-like domain-containing protein [Patescibacteria group bacterium]